MIYTDRVYGKFEITEPVLLDLVNCPSLQRLKGVDQYGYYEPQFPGHKSSRFDHSMGVFLILRKYGASLEEQITGLIHDVSHSAFSHCIDYAMEGDAGKSQSHQDSVFEEYVMKSEIPGVLERHGFNVGFILDDKNFPLKERELPDLCADRIDYIMRDAVVSNEVTGQKTDYLLVHLLVKDGLWFFDDLESAKFFKDLFSLMNDKYYASINAAAMHYSVGSYLRYALKKGYITWEDLYTTDREVLKKISKYYNEDAALVLLFEKMNMKYRFVNDPDNYEARVFCKSRIVDPLFLQGKELKRVSEVDGGKSSAGVPLSEQLQPKEHFIRFLT